MTEPEHTRPPDESPGGDEGELKDSFLDPNLEDDDLKDSAIHEPDPPLHAHDDDELKDSAIHEPDPPLHAHDDEPSGG